MDILKPASPEDLAHLFAQAAGACHTIQLGGAFTKNAMGGPLPQAHCLISTSAMNRVLQYEPRDLTISLEAGMLWSDLQALLAKNRQMVPLDPPFSATATVGGVVATNSSGPRRRVFGTARDLVIGMRFATLAGKLVQSGGMVVKNVAGLDMSKLLIGSFGTLAGIVTVNFKLSPMPEATRSFVLSFSSSMDAFAMRDRIVRSVLQPFALDAVNPAAAYLLGLKGWCLLVNAGGNAAVLDRYSRELPGASPLPEGVWDKVREFTPNFLRENPEGAVARLSTTLTDVEAAMTLSAGPALARAANGVVYRYFEDARLAAVDGAKAVIEYAPVDQKPHLALWPNPAGDFSVMEKLKNLFDPSHILNPGRLYGRI